MPFESEPTGQKLLMERYPATPGTPSFEIPMWVLRRQVDRQMVLLNLQSEQYFGLDDVGADIVTRVTEQPLEEALVALVDDYEADPEIVLRDVDNLIDDLMREGLLGRTETST
jgi:hypothetical protein